MTCKSSAVFATSFLFLLLLGQWFPILLALFSQNVAFGLRKNYIGTSQYYVFQYFLLGPFCGCSEEVHGSTG